MATHRARPRARTRFHIVNIAPAPAAAPHCILSGVARCAPESFRSLRVCQMSLLTAAPDVKSIHLPSSPSPSSTHSRSPSLRILVRTCIIWNSANIQVPSVTLPRARSASAAAASTNMPEASARGRPAATARRTRLRWAVTRGRARAQSRKAAEWSRGEAAIRATSSASPKEGQRSRTMVCRRGHWGGTANRE